jgi:hypothetical protein
MALELFAVAAIRTLPGTSQRRGTNQYAEIKDLISLGLIRPERFMDICNVLHFSGNPQLVSMLCCLFGSFRGILTQAQFGSIFAFAQYSSEVLIALV